MREQETVQGEEAINQRLHCAAALFLLDDAQASFHRPFFSFPSPLLAVSCNAAAAAASCFFF